ncbi:hypothetical protein HN51_029211 [Arachis hypogaea]
MAQPGWLEIFDLGSLRKRYQTLTTMLIVGLQFACAFGNFSVLAFIPLRDPIEPSAYHLLLTALLCNLVAPVTSGIFVINLEEKGLLISFSWLVVLRLSKRNRTQKLQQPIASEYPGEESIKKLLSDGPNGLCFDETEFGVREGTVELSKLKSCDSNGTGGCIIYHAPETGKTRLTIMFLQTFLEVFPDCHPIIIAPTSLLLAWKDEFRK